LALDVLDDGVDLGLGDPGPLHPDRLARPHRQEERVALADELLGARLVEDDPAVGERRGRERHPRLGTLALISPVTTSTLGSLGRQDQVDAGGPRELGDSGTIDSSTSRGATIIRSASSSTIDEQVRDTAQRPAATRAAG
jgi:hypothetical protein